MTTKQRSRMQWHFMELENSFVGEHISITRDFWIFSILLWISEFLDFFNCKKFYIQYQIFAYIINPLINMLNVLAPTFLEKWRIDA